MKSSVKSNYITRENVTEKDHHFGCVFSLDGYIVGTDTWRELEGN